MKKLLTSFFILFLTFVNAQDYKEEELNIQKEKDSIYGTLLLPANKDKPTLVILIAGSGPTDRNGNSVLSKNNSLKYLAEALGKQGIATYRYDKSSVHLQKNVPKEEAILFTQFVEDAKTVLSFLKKQDIFSKIYIAGHSQGSLIGMLISSKADGFISLAGPGNSIDITLKEQLLQQVPQLEESFTKTLNLLKEGKKDTDFNPMLSSIFRLSVQPFLISWMQYNPQEEIKKLEIPVLIINGTNDLQVGKSDALLLKKAKPDATIILIENMNHLFKEIKGDITENYASYNNPELPVMNELVNSIVNFIKEN